MKAFDISWNLLKALREQQHHIPYRERTMTVHPAIYGMLSRLQNVPEGGTPNLELSNVSSDGPSRPYVPPIPNTIDGEGSNFYRLLEDVHDNYYQAQEPIMRRDGKYTPQDMINHFYHANPEAAAKYFGTEKQPYDPNDNSRYRIIR